ncbi:hypothetical protein F53441_12662 [Fusarium austroafricanum]|uniref:Uncharacterized protein n=1 Tax=Fusarium austroafricanum TaxID=2364996 RepID=A0A8H4NP68_9HYPO|nr:hypothetical protein F53441_12662 [Fusarium austroafricanum]
MSFQLQQFANQPPVRLDNITNGLSAMTLSNKDRIIIALDFGTTYSGVAYCFCNSVNRPVASSVLDWEGLEGRTQPKVPTAITYAAEDNSKFKWGGQLTWRDDHVRGVKLLLDPTQTMPSCLPSANIKGELKKLPKDVVDVAADFLEAMYKHAMKKIQSKVRRGYLELCEKSFVLSVPAVWSDKAMESTIQAAKKAGIHPVTLIKEPEAAALYTFMTQERSLNPGDCFVVCDAGGGTVDLISYEVVATEPSLKLTEIIPRKGLNKRFAEAVQHLIGDEQWSRLKNDPAWKIAERQFDQEIKTKFTGDLDGDFVVNFPRAKLQDEVEEGLEADSWFMPGLVNEQVQAATIKRSGKSVQGIFLVGGFGASQYLKARIEQAYPTIEVIQPDDAWAAIAKGAALSQFPYTSVVATKATRHYGVDVNMEYDPALDQGRSLTFDEVFGRWLTPRMRWFIQKGDNLSRDRNIRHTFTRFIRKDYADSHLLFYNKLWMSETMPPPFHATDNHNIRLNNLHHPDDRSFRIVIDGKEAKLEDGESYNALAETVGKFHGGGYFHRNQNPKGDWTVAKVVARGTRLWANDTFDPRDQLGLRMHGYYPGNGNGKETPRFLFVGYSIYTLEPVLASSQSFDIDLDTDVLGDLQLDVRSEGTITENEFFPHHALTVPGNIVALKKLLVPKNWDTAFAGGDLTVDQAKDLAFESCRSLYLGDAPIAVTRIKPASIDRAPNHKEANPERFVYPEQRASPYNRQLKDVLPRAKHHLFLARHAKGFVYKAPYMSNMAYPCELYQELASFARTHTHYYVYEKFNATAMLFAVQLWVDIEQHPTKMQESYVREPLPSVSLTVFVVYFEHWLKVHEHLQCINYIHPYRFIQRMFINDSLAMDTKAFLIHDELDSARLREYVLDVKARNHELSAHERVHLFPFMISTTMVHPQDLDDMYRLSRTQLAMVGMPDLRVLGLPFLPSIYSPDRDILEIAIPKPIAQVTFCNKPFILQPDPVDLFDITADGSTSQFGNSFKSGTVWTHEFHSYVRDTGRTSQICIKPEMSDTWSQLLNRRMERLERLGVLGRVRLRADSSGLPGFPFMPSENSAHRLSEEDIANEVDYALKNPKNRI